MARSSYRVWINTFFSFSELAFDLLSSSLFSFRSITAECVTVVCIHAQELLVCSFLMRMKFTSLVIRSIKAAVGVYVFIVYKISAMSSIMFCC